MEVDKRRIDCLLENVRTVLPPNKGYIGYNIFSVLEIEEKEVIMCRMLADLLNPHGQHGAGNIFLRSFMKNVLHLEATVIDDVDKLHVTKEYPIDNIDSGPKEANERESYEELSKQPKRIDIVIHGAGHFIPIEVKIDASETGTQCWDYYQYALKLDRCTNLYFLTKHGTAPDKSIDIFILENCQERCKCISFEHDIVNWLESIIQYDFADEDTVVYNIVRQYLSSVIYFTDVRRTEMVERCAERVMEVDIEAGVAIAKSFTAIQDSLITKLFLAIEKAFPAAMNAVLDKEDENYWGKINKYFFGDVFGKGQKYISKKPCTCFRIKDAIANYPAEEILYIHIDWRIWAELRSGDRVSWIYLPVGDITEPKDDEKSDIPNFYTMNPAALKLNKPDEREKFINLSIEAIKSKLLK